MNLRIAPLTPELGPDYLAFFDGPAFCDNPDWAGCYCHFFLCPPQIDWQSLGAKENRAAVAARIEVGEMEGYLAYSGDQVVGWLNVQPRHRAPHAFAHLGIEPTPLTEPATRMASVLCFVIDPEHRRHGVARALLNGVLEDLPSRGFTVIEAYPDKGAKAACDHYHGPRALFDEAGFQIFREEKDLTVMRKVLGAR